MMVCMISRVAGQGRYAQVEREQRWALSALPAERLHPVSIVDRYVSGTSLRLRRMETETEVVYKLTQKVRVHPDRPETVKVTNLYLSEQEYATLAGLGGAQLRKTRWRTIVAGRAMAVDDFRGHLVGLILAETELRPGESRMAAPPLALADVTDDDRFSGETLAQATPEGVKWLLAHVAGLVEKPVR
jgi:CYTH domain-containing protein